MLFHRFSSAVPARAVADPSPAPGAFVFCPMVMHSPAHCQWQQGLYEYALAQARAVVRPSLLDRDLLAVWN